MKTNISSSFTESVDARACGFTLTELMVVIATIAMLGLLILTALASSGDNGTRVICVNNLRQLGMAVSMYASDNQDSLPWPNWADGKGWLYNGIPPNPNNPPWNTNSIAAWQGGAVFQYVKETKSYLCPVDIESQTFKLRTVQLSSYTMNAAAAFFPSGGTSSGPTATISSAWNPGCYLLWNPDPNTSFYFNDGANFPSLGEGVYPVHTVNGSDILTVGGNVQFVTAQKFRTETGSASKNLAWWNPNTSNGH